MFGIYFRLFPGDQLRLRKLSRLLERAKSRYRGVKARRRARARGEYGPRNAIERNEHRRYRRKAGFILTDLICAALAPDERFTIVDGGAREVDIDPRWRGHDPKRLRFYGFEVDEVECGRLNHQALGLEIESRYFPIGLWSNPEHKTFYVTKSTGGCSLFPVNHRLTDRWKMQNSTDVLLPKEAMRIERTEQIDVDSLDNISQTYGFAALDFMKLNVQGAELEILKGASAGLSRTLGLQVEVSFVESYVGRPLFSEIDEFLRSKGFYFFDLIGHHYLGRERSPITVRHMSGLSDILHGQFIEGHAIYFRDPIDQEVKGGDLSWANQITLLKLVSLAEVYHQIEFAIEVLEWSVAFLERRGDRNGATIAESILRAGVEKYRRYMS
jgi:FkbM family methyltransferase